MSSEKIAFFDTKPYDRESFDLVNKDIGFDIKYFAGHLNADTAELATGHQAVCAFVNDSLDATTIERLERASVKVAALRCAGYNNVDLKAAYGHLHVLRVPAYSPEAVAEHAVALIMTLNRKTHKAYFRTRDGNFSITGLLGFNMSGKVAGVVGTGRIGKSLVRILRGFGMEVLLFDAFPDQLFAKETGCEYMSVDTIYARADIISLHCPLTQETRHMIDERAIARMKPGVMLINTGRGGLVDTVALIEGLKSGRIGAAGLDVYEEESEYFFEDFSQSIISDDVLARLLVFPNVLITSHQGFFTKEALESIARTTLGNLADFFGARPLPNEICYRCNEAICQKKQGRRCF